VRLSDWFVSNPSILRIFESASPCLTRAIFMAAVSEDHDRNAEMAAHVERHGQELSIVGWCGDDGADLFVGPDGWTDHSWTGGQPNPLGWIGYLSGFAPGIWLHLEVLRENMLRRKAHYSGDWHQRCGIPMFNDLSVIRMSQRAWGDFMSALWNEALWFEKNEPKNYTSYAWDSPYWIPSGHCYDPWKVAL